MYIPNPTGEKVEISQGQEFKPLPPVKYYHAVDFDGQKYEFGAETLEGLIQLIASIKPGYIEGLQDHATFVGASGK